MPYSLFDNVISPVFIFMLKQSKTKNGEARLTLCSLPPPGKQPPKLGILRVPMGKWGVAIIQ